MTRSTPETVGGIALLTVALFGLLAISERAGLPLSWVKALLAVLAALAFLLVLALGRTTREPGFLGLHPTVKPIAGGILLGALGSVCADALIRPVNGAQWLACLLGMATGLAGGLGMARLIRNKEAPSPQASSRAADPLRGLGLVLLGAPLMIVALAQAAPELSRLLGLSFGACLMMASVVAALPILAGGAQGAGLATAALAGTGVTCAAALLAASGLTLGPLPLPGQSDPVTLQAIEAARASWRISEPLYFLEWPSLGEAMTAQLRSFLFAALLSGGIALALSPALPTARRTTAIAGIMTALLLPVVIIALGGYAIEAAAVRLIGAPMARPPASLIEAVQLGFVSACNSEVASAEAIRTACGVSPRDAAVFSWEHIRLQPAFLEGGYAAVLGLSTAFSIVASAIKLLLALGLATVGLWLAARGLGRDILARQHVAAGLASLRLGQVRLACAVFAGLAVALGFGGIKPSRDVLVFSATAGAFLIVVASLLKLRKVPQPIAPAPPAKRRRKAIASPQGEPA